MLYETFNEYIEQLSDAEFVLEKNDSGIFDLIFNDEQTYDCHYSGAYKHYKERFGEGEEAARLIISDILDKLFPREKYRVYFWYDFFKNDIIVRYRISRESLIKLLAHFYDELAVQITDDEKSGYIIIDTVKDILTSSGESKDIPADKMKRTMMVMTHSE